MSCQNPRNLNRRLTLLQPYPFERLRVLLAGVQPPACYSPIALSIGEPKHATPAFIRDALVARLDGLASYPLTRGTDDLRLAIAEWVAQRYGIPQPDPNTQVLPVNGSREALFAFAQAVIDPIAGGVVLVPNPFYQIYEGAALLAGARPWYVEQSAGTGFRWDWTAVPPEIWAQTRLIHVCSPGNPTGTVMTADEWRTLFELSDRYDVVIASDECYSEIYPDEAAPPVGSLQVAHALGRHDLRRLIAFSSLSKRSNVPGMRSGFVAGDAALIDRFLLYRTYHGSAMSPTVQAASVAAWRDEAHVVENRARYRAKFEAVTPVVGRALDTRAPEGGFYLWARVPGGDDEAFCRDLFGQYNVLVLPGSYLARAHEGRNPGAGFVRIALVDDLPRCLEAADRIVSCVNRS